MRPLLICLTPVKNNAWVLPAFLKTASLWADYIIIADQYSTDGSQDIAKNFEKVIFIENKEVNYNEPERQKILIDEARKIDGDKILITLDVDEIFSAGFDKTEDWKRILNSKPGEVFGFQWANVMPDLKTYYVDSFYFPWAFHDDGVEPHKNYARPIHSMRIPFPIKTNKTGWYHVNDFKVLHFNRANNERFIKKGKFYQILARIYGDSPFKIYRTHHNDRMLNLCSLPGDWLQFESNKPIIDDIDFSSENTWYDDEIIKYIQKYGEKKFSILDIWDKDFIKQNNLNDPRSFWIKLIHQYLRRTNRFSKTILIRLIDKIFKKCGL